MKKKDPSNCEIIRMYGIIGERIGTGDGKRQTLELNLLRWNGDRPVFNLRWWSDAQPLYGLSFTEKSLAELGDLIGEVFNPES